MYPFHPLWILTLFAHLRLICNNQRVASYIPQPAASTEDPTRHPVNLGAHVRHNGVDFAIAAPHATAVTLCLFSADRTRETCFSLNPQGLGVWAGFVPNIGEGQLYGYRIDGRWAPEAGLLYNPAKLLLDPYARAVTGAPSLHDSLFSPGFTSQREPLVPDESDSASYMALGVVTGQRPAVGTHPYIPWRDTVIYEAHVKGFTALNRHIPPELRGTYAGLAHPQVISYLKDMGITAIELLPIHAKMDEVFLEERELTNYWGYNTLNYFSPEPSYATRKAQEEGPLAVVEEVRNMIAALHAAGIEVILDVVYNHTCEGGVDGPTVSWRGIDNTAYYLSDPADPSQLFDTTGVGNTLDFRNSNVVSLALDSLRYWVEEMGVDGFRFDLAVTLGRNGAVFDPRHPFLVALGTDPVIRHAKLITEPWDVGPQGWRTGQFPPPLADWNDHFRNTARDFWVSAPRALSEGQEANDLRDFATRLAGSADLFGHGKIPGGRGTYASINFITAHDGFTLRDLVAHNEKHNEANRENNRDGSDHNNSWNFGHEGFVNVPNEVEVARRRASRNLLGTLILSAGTPMITAGDECGRSQGGNNNAYCQDNEISWMTWDDDDQHKNLLKTTAFLLGLRREIPALRPTSLYTKTAQPGDTLVDLQWFDDQGEPMAQQLWFDPNHRTLQMLRSGGGHSPDVLIVFNGSLEKHTVRLPEGRGKNFRLSWDSSWERPRYSQELYSPSAMVKLEPLSMRVFLS